jgi:GMP synthase-like glutamine amidotransferase
MKQLRIHCFQHVAFEGLGYIETWATQNGHILSSTKFFEEEFTFPNLSDFDWLIIMGGPMGVYNEEKYAWLKSEKEFIRNSIEADKTVIGICLGSQLIASALGAKVYPNKEKEIGWFPLTKTNEGKANPFISDLPDEFTTFHWHGDTFDLPNGATHLLKTDICPNQAFLYKDNVIGLQFHLEVTEQTIALMLENGASELKNSNFIQSIEEIQTGKRYIGQSNEIMKTILEQLTK